MRPSATPLSVTFLAPASRARQGLKITRSNEGCYRTSVRCPRCREQWGTPLSGLPPYSFNFMMQGYKQFCCDTCLFSFGCVTATHECPHCKAEFAFHPNDYHRKIRCESCEGEFGFYQYPVSERVENELREELKKEQARHRAIYRHVQRARGGGGRGAVCRRK